MFSFRPEIAKDLSSLSKLHSVEWSNDLKGGKAVYLSGLFDKLGYKVRKALSAESVKCSFSIAHCSVNFKEGHMGDVDFLIQSIGRDIPVIQPDSTGYTSGNKNSRVALQEQKEIFILPTIQISNLLQSEVEVFLSDKGTVKQIYLTIKKMRCKMLYMYHVISYYLLCSALLFCCRFPKHY